MNNNKIEIITFIIKTAQFVPIKYFGGVQTFVCS